jgi:hypothetical protein
MTSKELAAAGILPAKEEIQETEIAQLPEDDPAPAASGSENHEEGEVRSEGEDIEDVDAEPKDLIAVKQSKSIPPSFVFGESKVTTDMIWEYEAAGFFLLVTVVPPLTSKFLLPNRVKSLCFTISSLVVLGFLVILFYLLFWKVLSENSSIITEFISGIAEVLLDYENL